MKRPIEPTLPFHVKRSDPRALVAEAAGVLELRLAGPQVDSLLAFEELLRSRAVALGLIAEGDRDRILVRHVLDSLRAATALLDRDGESYDLGSGAGLPGIEWGVQVWPIMTGLWAIGLVIANRRYR